MIELNLWFPFSSKLYSFHAFPVKGCQHRPWCPPFLLHTSIWASLPPNLPPGNDMVLPHSSLLSAHHCLDSGHHCFSHQSRTHYLSWRFYILVFYSDLLFENVSWDALPHLWNWKWDPWWSREIPLTALSPVLFSPGACPFWVVENLDWSVWS